MPKKTNKYKRSTPVIRLLRNVEKLERHADLVQTRLISWNSEWDPQLEKSVGMVQKIMSVLTELRAEVEELVDSGFVPPKRSSAVFYEAGDLVAVAEKHREKYEDAFQKVISEDPDFLDSLVVVKVMDSGEITVSKGKRTPFIVRKSHLILREVE